jgi:ferrous iron transport protein B
MGNGNQTTRADQPIALLEKTSSDAAATHAPQAVRVAIVGIPNTGKSLLFQRLAGQFSVSANYPYTTTKLDEARTRLGRRSVTLIDTPGITGLELSSEDEAPTRALLREDPPDALILCMDAGNLIRSLALAAQLADLEIPSVVCLNMTDEALGRGILVDPEALELELGLPVFPTCATDGRGVSQLAAGLVGAARPTQVAYPDQLGDKLHELTPALPRAHRVERILAAKHQDLQPGQSLRHMVIEAHHHWAQDVARRVAHQSGLEPPRSVWQAVESVALHPVGSWVFLALALVVVYLLVAKVGVGILADGLERLVVAPATAQIAAWTGPGLWHEVLVGDFGLLSLGLFNAVCTVLPILFVFYLLYGFLEEIGYFPLLSVQFDRLLRLIGLTGRAVLPITLGFGCNTVATLATRSLPTGRQRFIASFMIALGIPCAVQLGVMVAILSATPVVAVLGLLGIVLLLQGLTGSTLARVLPNQGQGEFLVELPPLRRPRWRAIFVKTYTRLKEFFLEACPMFILSAGVLLTLEMTGLLARLRALLAPVVEQGFGLPARYADVLLMTLARREVGAVMLKEMVDRGELDLQQIFVGLLVMTLFVPCMSNTLVMGRVIGWLRTLLVFVLVTLIAIVAGVVTNQLWT